MAGAWVSTYCLNIVGFPRILHATVQKLEVKDHPKYEGREYEEHDTERCEVTVYIRKSEEFPDLTEAWSVTATGFSFIDTVDRISSAVLRGVSHEGRLIDRGARDQEQEGNRDTRVIQVHAVSMT